MSRKKKKAPKGEKRPTLKGEKRLIEAEDAEVVVEHHPEDWLAFVIFWSLASSFFSSFSRATYSMTASPGPRRSHATA